MRRSPQRYRALMPDAGAAQRVRLTELLTALSVATDLGMGQPERHMMRSTRLALRIGNRLGLSTADLATVFDVSLIAYVGCPVYGNDAAALFGDDIAFRAGALQVDLAGWSGRRLMFGSAGAGGSPWRRAGAGAALMAGGKQRIVEQMANHCAAAGVLAANLGLGAGVQTGLEQTYARWDGRGVPGGVGGDRVSLAARVAHVAEACELMQRTHGLEAVTDTMRARRGTQFDPAVVAAVLVDPAALFADLDEHVVEEVGEAEPIERPPLDDAALDHALGAIGDFCDLRSPYFAGHARTTAALAGAAGEALRLDGADVTVLRRAALVHDVGRFGVPATVWDHPRPLSVIDRERMRLHAYYVERIFARPEPLRRVGLLAATHHERMDGSGYHRGVDGTMLSAPARVLAAADCYAAMTQPRPHRPAFEPDAAAGALRAEAAAGRLDALAVDAVLGAAGQHRARTRAGGPAGLTARECDVLARLASGQSNKAIARSLGISTKTVGNHVEHIYTKLGVGNRAAAALRAMEHGIVARPGDQPGH